MIRVIVDLDAGIDDIYALLVLLFAKNIKIDAITCVRGNTTVDYVYKNVQRILKLKKREEIPVYIGANEPIVHMHQRYEPSFYGKDGFGDIPYGNEENTFENMTKISAAEAIVDLIRENPGEITLICLGPLTNVALAMKIFPSLVDNLKELLIMGGNYNENGKGEAEFNMYCDSEAAAIVFNKAVFPTVILPKETCESVLITTEWRFEVLGKLNNPVVDLLNKVEKQYFEKQKYWINYDPYLPAILVYSNIVETYLQASVSIELNDSKHKGEMKINPAGIQNAKIITKINTDLFKNLIYDVLKTE